VNASYVALLLVRVVVGGTMIAHGMNHWRGGGKIAGTARWFGGLGLRQPVLQAWMSVVTEVGAGTLLVIGLLTPLACAAVISVMRSRACSRTGRTGSSCSGKATSTSWSCPRSA
jgi:putative oxidoreductase